MEGSIMDLTPEFERTVEKSVAVALVGGEKGQDYRALSPRELGEVNQIKGWIVQRPRATLTECQEAAQEIVDRLDELAKLGTALPLEVEDPESRPPELERDWKGKEIQRANAALVVTIRRRERQLLQRAQEIAPASTPPRRAEALTAADHSRISQVVGRLSTFEMKRLKAETEVAFAEEWSSVLKSRLASYPEGYVVDRMTFLPPDPMRNLRPSLIAAEQSSGLSKDDALAAARYWRAAQDHFDGVMEEMDIKERPVIVKDRARADGVRWVAHLEALHFDAAETLATHDALRERLPVPALLKSALRF
jgi:hypothetical protein